MSPETRYQSLLWFRKLSTPSVDSSRQRTWAIDPFYDDMMNLYLVWTWACIVHSVCVSDRPSDLPCLLNNNHDKWNIILHVVVENTIGYVITIRNRTSDHRWVSMYHHDSFFHSSKPSSASCQGDTCFKCLKWKYFTWTFLEPVLVTKKKTSNKSVNICIAYTNN